MRDVSRSTRFAMELLDYLRKAQQADAEGSNQGPEVRIAIVTNVTDDLWKKVLTGMCLEEGLRPMIYAVPYKQYLFELKNPQSGLYAHQADITFFFFDVHPYQPSEFLADGHVEDILGDLSRYREQTKGLVVFQTIATPAHTPHGNLFEENRLYRTIQLFNGKLSEMAKEGANGFLLDTDRVIRWIGEERARDLRGLYAFSQPFSHDFILRGCQEWMSYIRAMVGKTKKCIVVDLDNTLWGGVVGEVGPLGIALGTDYPGNAFQQFQRLLVEYYDRGIILAINSRNNPEDVKEVFEKNPHMVLQESHFSAMAINWKTKAENLVTIAQELNIGLDSLVFFDDDAMNREMVRTQLPEVLVPDFSLSPEEYGKTLLQLHAFHSLRLTEEDKERGRMYAEERARRTVQAAAPDVASYLATLGIEIDLSLNDRSLIPRLAQLTQKTNQFNLTTQRLSEQDIASLMDGGAFIFAGDIRDKFGSYGVTIMAIIQPTSQTYADLHTFLMSCRVMGRRVEEAFFAACAQQLVEKGYGQMTASFIPTKKNPPISGFLPSIGAEETAQGESGTVMYTISLAQAIERIKEASLPIQINSSSSLV